MAGTVISFVIGRLGDFLISEVGILYGVRKQVEWLHDDLITIRCFLKDADVKQEEDRLVGEWVSKISYDVEDLIDIFILLVEDDGNGTQRKRGFVGFIERNFFINLYQLGSNRQKIQTKIQEKLGSNLQQIRTKIQEIFLRFENYGIHLEGGGEGATSSTYETLEQLRNSSFYSHDDDVVVGFKDHVNKLVAQLVKGESRRCVISIVGAAALGKTTLARKLYNCSDVKAHFNYCAWINVSRVHHGTKDLFQKIIKSFREPTKKEFEMMQRMEVEDLEHKLNAFLLHYRYLLVVDDIQNIQVWQSVKSALPDRRNGSRVILTTRFIDVASCADSETPPYNLPPLDTEQSWSLLRQKAFPSDVGASYFPQDLKTLGRKMAIKCGGFPLSIILLGRLLLRKEPHEWQRVIDHIDAHIEKHLSVFEMILALSYEELSFELKLCFLFLGRFPEDLEISCKKLIQLWVAEGFIPQEREIMEDVARDYLKELIDRSMIQVAQRSWDGLTVETCRIHDLVRGFSISKAEEGNFLSICANSTDILLTKARRHAIHYGIQRYISCRYHFSQPFLRSLSFFDQDCEGPLQMDQMEFIYSDFKLLRVLDLENFALHKLHDGVGELIHLKYLGLKGTGLKDLPQSIGKLQRLQTLDLRVSESLIQVPNVICQMKQLRHLQLIRLASSHARLQIDTLINLQTLEYIDADIWMQNDSVNLVNLRELDVRRISGSHGNRFSDSIARLSSLRSLRLETEETFPTLIPLSKCHNLHHLILCGKIEMLPEPHDLPQHLTSLCLKGSNLEQDLMATLEKLRSLKVLHLQNQSYVGKQMCCTEGGFPQLQVLQLQSLYELQEWGVEEGAIPNLCCLEIDCCVKLNMIPQGLKSIVPLRELKIRRMPKEFENRVGRGGEDFYKIRRASSIKVTNY